MSVTGTLQEEDLSLLNSIVQERGARPASILQILLDINHHYHYLPRASLEWVAERVRMPISQVFSVATFFKIFSLSPRGRHIVHVCTGTACHVKGTPRLLERVDKEFQLKPGQTTAGLELTLETVNCVGACASAPVVRIGEDTYSEVSPQKISELINDIVKKGS